MDSLDLKKGEVAVWDYPSDQGGSCIVRCALGQTDEDKIDHVRIKIEEDINYSFKCTEITIYDTILMDSAHHDIIAKDD